MRNLPKEHWKIEHYFYFTGVFERIYVTLSSVFIQAAVSGNREDNFNFKDFW